MKPSIHQLLRGAILAGSCLSPLAMAANCEWLPSGSTVKNYQRNIGTLYIPRDAPVGTVIGAVDMNETTSDNPTMTAECMNDGTQYLTFNARATASVFPDYLDPIDGEDVTGKILQTNIQGIGVRVKLGTPLDGRGDNSFVPSGGVPTVPYDGYNDRTLLIPIRLNTLPNRVTLVKTGPLPSGPGPYLLNVSELFSGHFPDLGKVFGYGLSGAVIQTQCTDSPSVSADPVQLGEWDAADFTGPGYTTRAEPFHITLSSCTADDSVGGFVTTANIQLEGVRGSLPIDDPSNGIFSLTTDSTAEGIGIQILKADGITPMELNTEVPVIAISTGTTVLDFNARFYQTEPSSAIVPGPAKGALNFTITYK